jgi:hypothetical protein
MLTRALPPLLAAPVLLSGCLDVAAPEDLQDPPIDQVTFSSSLNIDLGEFLEDGSGIWIREDEPGVGDPVEMGQEAGVYFEGWIATGEQFDSITESDGPPPEFVLGMPGPIAGLTFGLVGMRLGGERTVLVPPSLGFGWASFAGVPPGSWLVLSIRLVSIDGETEPPSDDSSDGGDQG